VDEVGPPEGWGEFQAIKKGEMAKEKGNQTSPSNNGGCQGMNLLSPSPGEIGPRGENE